MKVGVFSLVGAVLLAASATQSHAETIFTSDFDALIVPAAASNPAFNGNRFNGGTRRASNGPEFFIGNWVMDPTGFGGIDQVNSNGIPGILANNGVTTVATAFLNDGNNGGTGPVGTGAGGTTQGDLSDDTAPSGAFALSSPLLATDMLSFTLNATSNLNGANEVFFELFISSDTTFGNFESLGSGAVTVAAAGAYNGFTSPSVAVSDILDLTGSTEFNIQVVVSNPGAGNDQVNVRDIVVTRTAVPEPTAIALGLLGVAGVVLRRRR